MQTEIHVGQRFAFRRPPIFQLGDTAARGDQAEKNGQLLTLVINSDGKTVSYLPVSPTDNLNEGKDADKILGKE